MAASPASSPLCQKASPFLPKTSGQIVITMQLLENVWHLHFDPGTNIVDVHVGRLRRKLEVAGSQGIQTARGEGYIFAPLPPIIARLLPRAIPPLVARSLGPGESTLGDVILLQSDAQGGGAGACGGKLTVGACEGDLAVGQDWGQVGGGLGCVRG